MVTLKQILAQIRPGDWFASVDLKDAYFPHSDSAASQTVSEVCFREHSVPILCSPVRGWLWPRAHFQSVWMQHFPPSEAGGDAHPELSGRLADFSSVPGHATQPYRLAAIHLESLGYV